MSDVITRLSLANDVPFDRKGDVLAWGVPLKRGVVTAADALALRVNDRALPTQADALARWADGSVKWALLTAPKVDVAGGGIRGVELIARKPPKRAAKTGLSVRQSSAGVRVDTGQLRFTIARQGMIVRRFDRKAGGTWKQRGGALDLSMTLDHPGGRATYLASLEHDTREIDIESHGPLRSVIRVRGIHRSAGGDTFGPYTLRFEVFANSAQLRLTHSFVFDGDPARDFVRASEILLTAKVGGEQCFGFGGDDGREVRFERQRAKWATDYRFAELFQDSKSNWRVSRHVRRERRAVFCEEGAHTDGWMELSGSSGCVAVAVREMWQQHPKSLEADAETGELRVGLYPMRAPRLDLQRYSDLYYPNMYESPALWKPITKPWNPRFGAHGIRKTHDLLLMFDEANPSMRTLQYNHPLRLTWSPSYTRKTAVVRPATSKPHRAWKQRIDRYVDVLQTGLSDGGATGYLDYFDLPDGYNRVEQRWTHDYGGHGYLNDEAMPCLGLWQTYLITGDATALALARAMTRHNSDIDSYHIGPNAGKGTRHNVNHWGDQCKDARVSQPVGKRFLHYMTGDASVVDLARVGHAHMVESEADGRNVDMHARAASIVSTLLFVTETGVADESQWLLAIADAIAASTDEQGVMRGLLHVNSSDRSAAFVPDAPPLNLLMFSCFGGTQSFAELAERYDHQPLRDALVRYARHNLRPRDERTRLEQASGGQGDAQPDSIVTFRLVDLFGYAYEVTRDKAFVDHVKRHTQHVRIRIETIREPRYGITDAGSRDVPVEYSWPDFPTYANMLRKLRPFPHAAGTQFFEMAVYMHKAQGLMLLLNEK